MALVETLKTWDCAVSELDQQNVPSALSYFKKIPEKSSRIVFNIACCYELLGRLPDAEHGFDDAISRDKHFAIAYFQRAFVKFKLERYQEAFEDFDLCHKKMMDKKFIDYGQLGLKYTLYACEPLYNAGVSLLHKKDFIRAMDYLLQAQKGKCESRHRVIDETLGKLSGTFNDVTAVDMNSVKLLQLPPDGIFRPPKSKVANMNEIQFLEKAKVVAAASEDDTFTGFVGRKRFEEGGLSALQPPASPRRSPRRSPNNSPTPEAARLAAQQKRDIPSGAAKHFSRSHPPNKLIPPPPQKAMPVPPTSAMRSTDSNGPPGLASHMPRKAPQMSQSRAAQPDVRPKKTGLKPSEEHASELQKALSKIEVNGGVVRPPKHAGAMSKEPPPLPPKAVVPPSSKSRHRTSAQPSVNKPAPPAPPTTAGATGVDQTQFFQRSTDSSLVTIDLNCYGTVTIKVDRGTSLNNLLDVAASISEFNLEPSTFNLWYVGPDNQQMCIEDEEMMKTLWVNKADDSHLSLWCYATK